MHDPRDFTLGRYHARLITDTQVYRRMLDKFTSVASPAVTNRAKATVYRELCGKCSFGNNGFNVVPQPVDSETCRQVLEYLFFMSDRLMHIFLLGYSVGQTVYLAKDERPWSITGYTADLQVRASCGENTRIFLPTKLGVTLEEK